jgi:hypothetical protein
MKKEPRKLAHTAANRSPKQLQVDYALRVPVTSPTDSVVTTIQANLGARSASSSDSSS